MGWRILKYAVISGAGLLLGLSFGLSRVMAETIDNKPVKSIEQTESGSVVEQESTEVLAPKEDVQPIKESAPQKSIEQTETGSVVEQKSTEVLVPQEDVQPIKESAPQKQTEKATVLSNIKVSELWLFDEIFVTTATKRLQKLSEVPGSVTIISEQEIREKGVLTLKELLINYAGTEIAYEGIFETMRFRGMQASYNNKILVLIDGRKINTIDFGNYNANFGYNLDNIKQIEIVKGPGSSLYGANAFSGVINIITKDGQDIGGLNTKLSVGSKPGDAELSQYYLSTYGKKTGDLNYTVSAGYWRQLGFDPINLEAPNELFEGNKADLSLKYKDDWVVRAGYHKMEDPFVGSVYTPTPRHQNYEESFYLDMKYNFELDELSKLSLRLEDTYYYKNDTRQVIYNINRIKIGSIADLPPGAIMIIDANNNISPITDAVGGYYITFNEAMGLLDGTFLEEEMSRRGPLNEILFEAQYDLAWPQNNYFIAGLSLTHDWCQGIIYSSETVSDQNYAFYLQDEYHALDNLIILAGLRYDYNTAYGSNLSPRGSIIYSPLSELRIKALYGSAFRAPVFMERYTQYNYGFYEAVGNADLKPEKIEQCEAGIEYEIGKWFQIKGGYFYWETKDEIQFDYELAPLFVYSPPALFYTRELNQAPAMISWSNNNSRIGHGIELESTFRPIAYTQLKLNYTRINLYSRQSPQHPSWAEGVADMFNGMMGFNYENLFFINFYAHFGRMPNQVGASESFSDFEKGLGLIKAKWLSQYDLSVGGKYKGVGLTIAAFNIFENPMVYNTVKDNYIKGERIVRVNADYTFKF